MSSLITLMVLLMSVIKMIGSKRSNVTNKKYLLSIITVEKDDEIGWLKTKSSLGGIPDTVQWITKSHSSEIDSYDCNANEIKIKSNDHGIYNAMNIALNFCDAEWILFLNSGDCLVIGLNDLTETLMKYENSKRIILFNWLVGARKRQPRLTGIRYGSSFSHQAAIISADLFETLRYSEEYSLASDYDFFVKMHRKSVHFDVNPAILSRILPGGVSDTRRVDVFREFKTIQNKNGFNRFISFLNYTKNIFLDKIKRVIKKTIKL